jgi:uncharacterized protein YbjT (DUF2867 family)
LKTALIAGASGLVGSQLLKLLQESSLYDQVHVLTRRPLDLGGRGVFVRIDHDLVVSLGDCARHLRANRFLVVSSLGANPKSAQFYLQVKGEMESSLSGLNLDQLLIFRPSLLKGDRDDFRPGEAVSNLVMRLFAPVVPAKLQPVAGDVLARAMLRAAGEAQEKLRVYESDEIRSMGRI